MNVKHYLLLILLLAALTGHGQNTGPVNIPAYFEKAAPLKGSEQATYRFMFDGREARLAVPEQAAPGRPWVWRALFWGHEPQADVALLNKGYHIAYIQVADLHGSPQAVACWQRFYRYLTDSMHLSARPALECMSRAGLIGFNWAAQYPAQVACIYADAPVLDIRSWPGHKGRVSSRYLMPELAEQWRQCLQAYGLSEQQALHFKGNPLDKLSILAKHKIPLLHICGMADTVVPYSENTGILVNRYRQLNGNVQEIQKQGVGHHPHSLPDPQPIVSFIVTHTRYKD